MRYRWLWCWCILLLSLGSVEAATFYVDGGCGSVSTYVSATRACTGGSEVVRPTIQLAHDIGSLAAGDTILVRGGTYTLAAQQTLTKNGSSGNLIKLWNYPGETPIIDGISLSAGSNRALRLSGASWWHIKGLEVKNAPAQGIFLTANAANNIIEFCNFHHNVRTEGTGAGVHMDTSAGSNNLFLNNDSHHQSYGIGGTGGDGFTCGTQASGNVFRGNRAWRNNDDGFDCSWALNILIENNWSWENGLDDSLQKTSGDGSGFKLGLQPAPDNGGHTVRQNLAWDNALQGFDCNNANLPLTLHNNTAWHNNTSATLQNYRLNQGSGGCDTTAYIARNNIAFDPNSANMNANVVHDHNSWDSSPSVTVSSADFVTTVFTANIGARQADGSLPVSTFLHLVTGSDLIDKGVDVGLAFNGSAPDLGAVEFGTAAATGPDVLYHLDDATGTTANDALGSLDGTLVNTPLWTDGKVNGGLSFNGTTQYVSATSPNLSGALTIAAWIYMSSLTPTWQTILANFDAAAAGAQFELSVGNTGTLLYTYRLQGPVTRQFTSATGLITTGVWIHVAVTDDGADGIQFYINGSTVADTPSGTATAKPATAPGLLGIGRAGAFNGQYLAGILDEIYLQDSVMTLGEIQALAAAVDTAPAAPTNLRIVSP